MGKKEIKPEEVCLHVTFLGKNTMLQGPHLVLCGSCLLLILCVCVQAAKPGETVAEETEAVAAAVKNSSTIFVKGIPLSATKQEVQILPLSPLASLSFSLCGTHLPIPWFNWEIRFRWMRFSLMLDQSSGPSSLLPSQRRSLRGSPWRETSPPATLEWDMFNCEGSGSAADLLCLPTLNLSCFFVRISSMKEDAETAMKDLKNKPFKGQTLHLTLAKPKPKSELFLRNQPCLGPTFSPPISLLSPLQPRRRRMVLKLQRYQSPSR